MLRRFVFLGAIFLIALGVMHAIHVGRADDVEPYLWAASLFMLVQGSLTILLLLRSGQRM